MSEVRTIIKDSSIVAGTVGYSLLGLYIYTDKWLRLPRTKELGRFIAKCRAEGREDIVKSIAHQLVWGPTRKGKGGQTER